jgi:hypothetical protein
MENVHQYNFSFSETRLVFRLGIIKRIREARAAQNNCGDRAAPVYYETPEQHQARKEKQEAATKAREQAQKKREELERQNKLDAIERATQKGLTLVEIIANATEQSPQVKAKLEPWVKETLTPWVEWYEQKINKQKEEGALDKAEATAHDFVAQIEKNAWGITCHGMAELDLGPLYKERYTEEAAHLISLSEGNNVVDETLKAAIERMVALQVEYPGIRMPSVTRQIETKVLPRFVRRTQEHNNGYNPLPQTPILEERDVQELEDARGQDIEQGFNEQTKFFQKMLDDLRAMELPKQEKKGKASLESAIGKVQLERSHYTNPLLIDTTTELPPYATIQGLWDGFRRLDDQAQRRLPVMTEVQPQRKGAEWRAVTISVPEDDDYEYILIQNSETDEEPHSTVLSDGIGITHNERTMYNVPIHDVVGSCRESKDGKLQIFLQFKEQRTAPAFTLKRVKKDGTEEIVFTKTAPVYKTELVPIENRPGVFRNESRYESTLALTPKYQRRKEKLPTKPPFAGIEWDGYAKAMRAEEQRRWARAEQELKEESELEQRKPEGEPKLEEIKPGPKEKLESEEPKLEEPKLEKPKPEMKEEPKPEPEEKSKPEEPKKEPESKKPEPQSEEPKPEPKPSEPQLSPETAKEQLTEEQKKLVGAFNEKKQKIEDIYQQILSKLPQNPKNPKRDRFIAWYTKNAQTGLNEYFWANNLANAENALAIADEMEKNLAQILAGAPSSEKPKQEEPKPEPRKEEPKSDDLMPEINPEPKKPEAKEELEIPAIRKIDSFLGMDFPDNFSRQDLTTIKGKLANIRSSTKTLIEEYPKTLKVEKIDQKLQAALFISNDQLRSPTQVILQLGSLETNLRTLIHLDGQGRLFADKQRELERLKWEFIND